MAKQRKRSGDEVPELGHEWFAGATKIADGPKAMREFMQAHRRGRGPQKAPTKKLVSLRLTADSLERYRHVIGKGWQSRLSADVDKAAKRLKADA